MRDTLGNTISRFFRILELDTHISRKGREGRYPAFFSQRFKREPVFCKGNFEIDSNYPFFLDKK